MPSLLEIWKVLYFAEEEKLQISEKKKILGPESAQVFKEHKIFRCCYVVFASNSIKIIVTML